MSLSDLLSSAASEAQSILAEMAGAASADATNFTLATAAYQGVLSELSTQVPGGPTGFDNIRELRIVATRAQFAAKPDAATRPAVTALGASWYLNNVGESPQHYFLTCRPA